MSETTKKNCSFTIAKQIIYNHGGIIRTAEAIKAGIHPRILYKLRDIGELKQLSRGVYRLAELKELSNPDLLVIATRIPNAVICLTSALSFHELTTQIPHEISIAILPNAPNPSINYPPIRIHKFSSVTYNMGINEYQIDNVSIKIYNPEKTIVDCFKFRNKIGMDIVLEALKLYKTRMKFDHKKILEYAQKCRIDKIIIPYLEANLWKK